MKRTLLILSFVLLAAWGFSQSLQLSSYQVAISGDIDSLLHSTAVVHNIGTSTIDVRAERTNENLAPSHYSYFCWANNCYSPSISFSPFTTPLAPGDSSISGPQGFIAYLQPQGAVGASDVTYCFYDDANMSDSVCITFNYNAIVTGIRELIASGITLTNAAPSPANNLAQIGMNVPGLKNGRLVFYNMLGVAVKEINVTEKQNLLTVSTADLKNGMYVYSLYNNGKMVATKKMLVSHR